MILGDLEDIGMEDGIGLKHLIVMKRIHILFRDINIVVISWAH